MVFTWISFQINTTLANFCEYYTEKIEKLPVYKHFFKKIKPSYYCIAWYSAIYIHSQNSIWAFNLQTKIFLLNFCYTEILFFVDIEVVTFSLTVQCYCNYQWYIINVSLERMQDYFNYFSYLLFLSLKFFSVNIIKFVVLKTLQQMQRDFQSVYDHFVATAAIKSYLSLSLPQLNFYNKQELFIKSQN